MYTKESKALSYLLRHGAEKESVPITKEGWVRVADVITFIRKSFPKFTQAILEQIVREDEKGRYKFNPAMDEIRANQGHSLENVKLSFKQAIPPVILYHGTNKEALKKIQKTGIQKMNRHHVHLAADTSTACSVGIRQGSLVLISINCKKMVADGIKFFLSDNGVWLTDFVDPKYFEQVLIQS